MIKKEFIETQNKQLPKDESQTIIEHCKNRTLNKEEKAAASTTEAKKQKISRKKELLYKGIHDLHKQGMSSCKIAAALCINKATVLTYLKYDTCLAERIIYENNYEAYIDIIIEECGKGEKRKKYLKESGRKNLKGSCLHFIAAKNYPHYIQKN